MEQGACLGKLALAQHVTAWLDIYVTVLGQSCYLYTFGVCGCISVLKEPGLGLECGTMFPPVCLMLCGGLVVLLGGPVPEVVYRNVKLGRASVPCNYCYCLISACCLHPFLVL
jgi:hypothetical protein